MNMRRLITSGLVALSLVAFPAVAFCQKVSLEFDETRDFSDFKTFAIAAGKLNSKNPSLNNELVQKQLENEIRRRLTERTLIPPGGVAMGRAS
jgi:hypothetical protein